MSVVPSHEVMLSQKRAFRDVYRSNIVYPTSGAQNLTLTNTNNLESIFEIPSKPVNLAKSYIQFKMTTPAVAARQNAMFCRGAPMIERMSLYTRSGLYLADIPHMSAFSQTVLPATTEYSDMKSNGQQVFSTAPGNLYGTVNSIGAVGQAVDLTATLDALVTGIELKDGSGMYGASPYVASHGVDGLEHASAGSDSLAHVMISNALNVEMVTNHTINLDICRHTIMSMDKTLYFPEVLLLRVQWATTGSFSKSYLGIGGGVTDTRTPVDTPQINVENLGLHLALSSDPIVMQESINGVLGKGVDLTVPFVHSSLSNYNTASQSINLRLNSGFGQRLLCIYSTVFSHGANPHRHVCNNNSLGNLVQSYYTALDSQRLQDSNVRALNREDYAENRKLLRGSVLGGLSYAENFVHIDSFRAGSAIDWIASDGIDDGLSLINAERTFTYFQEVGAAPSSDRYTYVFMIVQKSLHMSAEGISLV